MTDEQQVKVGYELLQNAVLANISVISTEVGPTSDDDSHVRIEARIGDEEDDDVEWAAFGVIFALAVLSFADARPRGISDMHFEEKDDFGVDDFLRHLTFRNGELHFYADYVRGRMMKTEINVRRDGTFLLETVNRGQAATRWVSRLQGKKILSVVPEDGQDVE